MRARFSKATAGRGVRSRRLLALYVPWLVLCGACASATDATVVYLVRHAEKVDDSRDPALSAAGVERATALAAMLADADVTRVLSSDFDRTRSTARPLANALGLDVELYDARNLEATAATIRSAAGRYLVSGHSNTTPALVELLGGEAGEPIREADEYDRLYVLTLLPDQTITVLLRYGARPGS